MKIKALFYTSDHYEPSGLLGLFNTEEEKQNILKNIVEIDSQYVIDHAYNLNDESYNDYLFRIRDEKKTLFKKRSAKT